jgi:two-component system response regulator YesN
MARELRRGDAQPAKTDPELMDSARLYIDQNYMRDISLDDVSAFTGFSKCYFSRIFKQQFGISPKKYQQGNRPDTVGT